LIIKAGIILAYSGLLYQHDFKKIPASSMSLLLGDLDTIKVADITMTYEPYNISIFKLTV
jgi:hypothetical protein